MNYAMFEFTQTSPNPQPVPDPVFQGEDCIAPVPLHRNSTVFIWADSRIRTVVVIWAKPKPKPIDFGKRPTEANNVSQQQQGRLNQIGQETF